MTTRSTSGRPNLRRQRTMRGWSENDVAVKLYNLGVEHDVPEDELGVDARTVSRWELGKARPNQTYRALLSLLYNLPLEQLDLPPLVLPVASTQPVHDPASTSLTWGDGSGVAIQVSSVDEESITFIVKRRAFLEAMGGTVAAVATGQTAFEAGVVGMPFADSLRVLARDPRVVADMSAVTIGYARQVHILSPQSLQFAIRTHLAALLWLDTAPLNLGQRRELHLATGRTTAIAGKLSFALGHWSHAHANYAAASAIAGEVGDGPLRAFVLGQSSHLYSRLWVKDQPIATQPIALLDEALRVAGSHPPQLRLWLLARRAEEHAAAKEAKASLLDLDDAERIAASIQSRDDGFLAHWDIAPAARLAGYRGNCAQLLNRPADAISAIERGMGAIDPSLISVRSSVLADLAAAYAQQEEIERACTLLLESLDIAERAGLGAYVQRVITVRRQLGRWSGQPEVKQLDERLRAVR